MGRLIDLTGQRFGRLIVLQRAEDRVKPSGHKIARWKCLCDCGNQVIVLGQSLRSGITGSCGCFRNEVVGKRATTHGGSASHLYKTWTNMLQRCENARHQNYDNYGKRGISVCDEWHNFQKFSDWAKASGYEDGLTIDRIDVNGNYAPFNCRWVNMVIQGNNKRNNHLITLDGERHTLSEWCIIRGIRYGTLLTRLSRGWSEYDALTKPLQSHLQGKV